VLFFLMWISIMRKLPSLENKGKNGVLFLMPLIFIVVLTLWGGHEAVLSFPRFSMILDMRENWLWGVGEGQFLAGLRNLPSIVAPEQLRLPEWGILHTFFEKGFFGLFITEMLIFVPIVFCARNKFLLFSLFLGFWVFTADLMGTENGILILGTFLLVEEKLLGKD